MIHWNKLGRKNMVINNNNNNNEKSYLVVDS